MALRRQFSVVETTSERYWTFPEVLFVCTLDQTSGKKIVVDSAKFDSRERLCPLETVNFSHFSYFITEKEREREKFHVEVSTEHDLNNCMLNSETERRGKLQYCRFLFRRHSMLLVSTRGETWWRHFQWQREYKMKINREEEKVVLLRSLEIAKKRENSSDSRYFHWNFHRAIRSFLYLMLRVYINSTMCLSPSLVAHVDCCLLSTSIRRFSYSNSIPNPNIRYSRRKIMFVNFENYLS